MSHRRSSTATWDGYQLTDVDEVPEAYKLYKNRILRPLPQDPDPNRFADGAGSTSSGFGTMHNKDEEMKWGWSWDKREVWGGTGMVIVVVLSTEGLGIIYEFLELLSDEERQDQIGAFPHLSQHQMHHETPE
ncbi:hypothetical protein NA56DRAFT_703313 [Hyaloscypha hepaticicola]|uniref:Uncharacterized protein n=1 Tax=Hyaloscypha hepaticicola TaxID=2082293 RepID=A0A2J6Q605_9HELO|nr:hypothetical protein NA56DRAFT_703313 [Hyaloscypha hepaticicola]